MLSHKIDFKLKIHCPTNMNAGIHLGEYIRPKTIYFRQNHSTGSLTLFRNRRIFYFINMAGTAFQYSIPILDVTKNLNRL